MTAQRATDGPMPGDLQATLREVAEILDAVAAAVLAHDRIRLDSANARATALLTTLAAQITELDGTGGQVPADGRVTGLVRRLRAAVRRNSMLIERAWAMDAATTRLLLSLGRGPVESPAGAYATVPILSIERNA
ncbi:MAG: hypothetical protein C0498_05125 [Anaerolinea sp.]|nr:hypothetical protein [Anaerolinea sp.]